MEAAAGTRNRLPFRPIAPERAHQAMLDHRFEEPLWSLLQREDPTVHHGMQLDFQALLDWDQELATLLVLHPDLLLHKLEHGSFLAQTDLLESLGQTNPQQALEVVVKNKCHARLTHISNLPGKNQTHSHLMWC